MTKLECPNCKKPVDIDSPNVVKEERGLELAVKCPYCKTDFLVQRVAEVRRKLKIAKYGFTTNAQGQEIKIKLSN
jgi:endogenous inhibitor of DNA gyrase (YacG/DUF329 family)